MAKLKSLRTLRESVGMSQRDLAVAAGCSHGFISHLEAGRVVRCKDELARRIAEALRVDVADLFVLDMPRGTRRDGQRHVAGESIKEVGTGDE